MSAGEHFAGAAMRASKGMNADRDALVLDIVEAMEPVMRKVLREELPQAAASVITPEAAEQFWTVGFEVMKKQAANRAGLWLFGRVGNAMNLLFWGAVALYAAYQIAGWAGIKLFLFSKGP